MMLYEWDKDKDKDLINRREHKMPLEAGIAVFDDLNAIDFQDTREDYGEDRYVTIGRDGLTKLLFVVYTMRGHFSTRLISVRKATKQERLLYENGRIG